MLFLSLGSEQLSEFLFCTVELLISLGVVRPSLARRLLEHHGVLSSCSDMLQELGAAAPGSSSLVWTWGSYLRGLFAFELCLAGLEEPCKQQDLPHHL